MGLSHLVAVSGFQVVLVFSFLERLSQQLGSRQKSNFFLGLVGICTLVFIVGPQPPVLRSGLSVAISQFGLSFLGVKLHPLRALVYACILLLWYNPLFLLSVSFQLSFVATLSLILFNWKNQDSFLEANWYKEIWTNTKSSLAAFLFTLPIIAQFSSSSNPFAILLNILVTPVIPIITALNILGLIPVLGDIFLIVSYTILSFVFFIIVEFYGFFKDYQFDISLFKDLFSLGIFYIFIIILVSIWYSIEFEV